MSSKKSKSLENMNKIVPRCSKFEKAVSKIYEHNLKNYHHMHNKNE